MGLGAQVAVTEIGESERKAVWKKDNELRFRDVEFGESVGRYLKNVCQRSEGSLFQPGAFLRDRKQMAPNFWPLVFKELPKARPV